jgi:hypothetical protein
MKAFLVVPRRENDVPEAHLLPENPVMTLLSC